MDHAGIAQDRRELDAYHFVRAFGLGRKETLTSLLVDHCFPLEGGDVPDFGRDDLARLFGALGFKRGAEIGVERGLYSEVLLRHNPGLTELWLVDPWKTSPGYREHVSQSKLDAFYRETHERVAPWPAATCIRATSVEAARMVADRSLDFVYIDANHDFQNVVQDIGAWLPKIRPGGIISGHDFIRRNNDITHHVVQAVRGWTECYKVAPWWVLGRRERREGETRDKNRSWLWVV